MLLRRQLGSCSSLLCRSGVARLYASAAAEEYTAPTPSTSSVNGKPSAPRKRKTTKSTKEEENPPSKLWTRNLLEATKVEEFLTSLSDQATVTIEDLERHRPRKHSRPGTAKYQEEYNKLMSILCQSFSKKQLRHVGKLYNLDRRLIRTGQLKPAYATAIIEKQWNWPSLSEVQKHNLLWSTYAERSFPVTPSEMFFIIGKDGSDLLSLASRHKVHVSLLPKPLQLRVEGIQGELDKLSIEIDKMKSYAFEETVNLPVAMALPQDIVQRVSRLSSAYIQNFGPAGQVRLCAKEPRSLETAKRLLTRAVFHDREFSSPVLAYDPPVAKSDDDLSERLFPHSYSMYPFTPAHPTPWTSRASKLYRARRVGEWIGINTTEDIRRTGGIGGGYGHILSIQESITGLKPFLLSKFSSGATIRANFGHVLIPSASNQPQNIVPPLQGSWPLPKILTFLRSHPTAPEFLPSLPTMFLESRPTSRQVLHRLEYRTVPPTVTADEMERKMASKSGLPLEPVPLKFIRWESILAEKSLAPTPSAIEGEDVQEAEDNGVPVGQDSDAVTPEADDIPLDEWKSIVKPDLADSDTESSAPPPAVVMRPYRCLVGAEATTNLLIPDRPMDIQFHVFSGQPLTQAEEPTQLQEYLNSVNQFLSDERSSGAQPDPPPFFYFRGEEYLLYSNLSVRRSSEVVKTASKRPASPMKAFTERIVDLESMQKSSSCELLCDDDSEEAWTRFLQGCDHITTSIPRRASTP